MVDVSGTAPEMRELMEEIFPLCRSITGDGVRETLRSVGRRLALDVHEVPSGTAVLDWIIPDEWNIRDAFIARDGRRIVDFKASNLHVMSYSEPVRAELTLDELRPHLHASPDRPAWIPYRTSYYKRAWGFCLSHDDLELLLDADYEVVVDSTLEPGSLTYGECVLPGESSAEVVLTTHVCHPSMANDNATGIAVLTTLGRVLAARRRELTYRLLFIPGTIGSITWLARNEEVLPRVMGGLVLACLGDPASLAYKRSRRGDSLVDRAAAHIVLGSAQGRVIDFVPWGWDERQFNTPGFDLPIGCLSRSREGEYAEYHSSGDDLDFVQDDQLVDALSVVLEILDVLESDRTYLNLAPKGEPQLGKRGLFRQAGGPAVEEAQLALLWTLNLSDGNHSLLAIAERSGLGFGTIRAAADRLLRGGLLAEVGAST